MVKTPELKAIEARLHEANSNRTYSVGIWYITLAKIVSNPYDKERGIHKIIEKYHERVTCASAREFFRVSSEAVKDILDLIDGEYINIDTVNQERKLAKEAALLEKAAKEAEKKAAEEEVLMIKAQKKAKREELEKSRSEKRLKKHLLRNLEIANAIRFISERVRLPITDEEKLKCRNDPVTTNKIKTIVTVWKKDVGVKLDSQDVINFLTENPGEPTNGKWTTIRVFWCDEAATHWDMAHAPNTSTRFIMERVRLPITDEEKLKCRNDPVTTNKIKTIVIAWKKHARVELNTQDFINRLTEQFGEPINGKEWPMIEVFDSNEGATDWDMAHAANSS